MSHHRHKLTYPPFRTSRQVTCPPPLSGKTEEKKEYDWFNMSFRNHWHLTPILLKFILGSNRACYGDIQKVRSLRGGGGGSDQSEHPLKKLPFSLYEKRTRGGGVKIDQNWANVLFECPLNGCPLSSSFSWQLFGVETLRGHNNYINTENVFRAATSNPTTIIITFIFTCNCSHKVTHLNKKLLQTHWKIPFMWVVTETCYNQWRHKKCLPIKSIKICYVFVIWDTHPPISTYAFVGSVEGPTNAYTQKVVIFLSIT